MRSQPSQGAEYSTLSEVLALLWRQKIPLGLCALLGGALGLGIALSQQKTYQARTSIEVRMPNDDYLNRRGLDPTLEPGQIMIEPFLQTQMKLVQSETLLLSVANSMNLARHREFNPAPGLLQRLMGKSANPAAGLTRGQLLESLQGRLTVRLLGQTQVMEILFSAADPALAAEFTNRLASAYKENVLARRVNSMNETEALLGKQLSDMRKVLQESEAKLQNYVSANGLLPTDLGRDSVAESRLRQIQSALTSAQEARHAEKTRFDFTRQAHADKPGATLESEALRSYRAKMTDLRQKLAEAESIYKPDHYRVKQVKAELEQVERSFEQERDGILVRSRGALDAAVARESALAADFDAQVRKVAGETVRTVHYGTLKSEVETNRQMYAALMQKFKDASVASALQTSSVLVVDSAAPPERPFKPNKPFHLALGLAGGSFLGLLAAFARERRERETTARFDSDQQFTSIGGSAPSTPLRPVPIRPAIPNLGSIPEIHQLRAPMATAVRGLQNRPDLSSAVAPSRGPDAEAFQDFIGTLLGRHTAEGGASVLLVTSALQREGRTAIASNLASATASAGKDVLIIDGDSSNPSLHQVFSIPNEFGFSDLLAMDDAAECEASVMGAVWLTETPGVYVLPAGSAASKIPLLDRGNRARNIVEQLRREFDLVLIDSPPVLSGASAARLARLADDTVLVIRAGNTSPDSVDEALRILKENKIHVLGAIQNLS